MSATRIGNFETRNRSSGSKLILLARPNEDVLDQVNDLAPEIVRRHGLTGRRRPDDVLHVSIAGFGPYAMIPFAQVNALRHILSRMEFDAFDIAFDRVASFQGSYGYPLVFYSEHGNDALIKLEKSVAMLLEPYSGKPKSGRYRPHMTLLYDRTKVAGEPIGTSVSWRVKELVLVESLDGQTVYRPICTFPCRPPEPTAHWQLPANEALRSDAAVRL